MIVDGAIEDSSTNLDSSVESHPTSSLNDIAQSCVFELELSCFVSMIHLRPSCSSHVNYSKSLSYIVIVLCHRLLSIDVEVLLKLFSLYVEENSLLNCGVALGLKIEVLQL